MGWVADATLRLLYLRERPGTHCTGDWVGPKAGLDGCGKSHPSPGFDPRTVQRVAIPTELSRPPGTLKYSEKIALKCHPVHNKSHTH